MSSGHATRTAQAEGGMVKHERPVGQCGRHFKARPTELDAKLDSKESKRGSEDGSGLQSSELLPSLWVGIFLCY